MDGVSCGVIGHAEVHRFADVPEPDIVVAADGVGGHVHPLAVHVDGLGTWRGCELLDGGAGGAAQGEAGEDAEPHEDRFPFSVHAVTLLSVLLCLWQTQPCRRSAGKSRTIGAAVWRKTGRQTKHIAQRQCASYCFLRRRFYGAPIASASIEPAVVMFLQHIFEFDTAVGFLHLLDAPPAEIVQLAVVDLQPCRQHVHHHADLHGELE